MKGKNLKCPLARMEITQIRELCEAPSRALWSDTDADLFMQRYSESLHEYTTKCRIMQSIDFPESCSRDYVCNAKKLVTFCESRVLDTFWKSIPRSKRPYPKCFCKVELDPDRSVEAFFYPPWLKDYRKKGFKGGSFSFKGGIGAMSYIMDPEVVCHELGHFLIQKRLPFRDLSYGHADLDEYTIVDYCLLLCEQRGLEESFADMVSLLSVETLKPEGLRLFGQSTSALRLGPAELVCYAAYEYKLMGRPLRNYQLVKELARVVANHHRTRLLNDIELRWSSFIRVEKYRYGRVFTGALLAVKSQFTGQDGSSAFNNLFIRYVFGVKNLNFTNAALALIEAILVGFQESWASDKPGLEEFLSRCEACFIQFGIPLQTAN